MAIIIEEFNLLYKYPNSRRNAYAILSGQPSVDPTTPTTLVPSQSSKIKYSTYSLPHKLRNCK